MQPTPYISEDESLSTSRGVASGGCLRERVRLGYAVVVAAALRRSNSIPTSAACTRVRSDKKSPNATALFTRNGALSSSFTERIRSVSSMRELLKECWCGHAKAIDCTSGLAER